MIAKVMATALKYRDYQRLAIRNLLFFIEVGNPPGDFMVAHWFSMSY